VICRPVSEIAAKEFWWNIQWLINSMPLIGTTFSPRLPPQQIKFCLRTKQSNNTWQLHSIERGLDPLAGVFFYTSVPFHFRHLSRSEFLCIFSTTNVGIRTTLCSVVWLRWISSPSAWFASVLGGRLYTHNAVCSTVHNSFVLANWWFVVRFEIFRATLLTIRACGTYFRADW